MAVTETIKLVNKEGLPEEFDTIEGLGKNDKNQLVFIDIEGNTKVVQGLGDLLMRTLVESGAAEEVAEPQFSSEAQAVIDQLKAQVDTLQQEKAELEKRLSAYDARFDQQQAQIDDLRSKLERRDQSVDGFFIGDEIGLQDDDNEELFERGYEVVGFSDENENGIVINHLETGEELEVPSSKLVHEDELLTNQDILEETYGWVPEKGDRVQLRQEGGAMASGWEVAGEPEYDEEKDDWFVDVSDGNETRRVPVSELELAERGDDAERQVPYRRPKNLGLWTGARVRLGEYVSGRRAHAAIIRDRDGRRVRVTEEEIGPNGYVESDRAAGGRAAILIGAAAIAGALLWELWEHKISGHSNSALRDEVHRQVLVQNHVNKAQTAAIVKSAVAAEHTSDLKAFNEAVKDNVNHAVTTIDAHTDTTVNNAVQTIDAHADGLARGIHTHLSNVQGKISAELWHDHSHEIGAIHGNEKNPIGYYGGNHFQPKPIHYGYGTDMAASTATPTPNASEKIQYFNDAQGHRLTGVKLPSNLKLTGNSTIGYNIVDLKGNTVVNHVNWDQQGNLSVDTRNTLRSSGYDLKQDSLGRRFITVVSTS